MSRKEVFDCFFIQFCLYLLLARFVASLKFYNAIDKMTSYQFRSDEILVCRKRLLNWYTQFKRPLPWRDPSNKTPYSIWISEIMSQQTRIETVIPYWKRWMDMYPSVQALSQVWCNEYANNTHIVYYVYIFEPCLSHDVTNMFTIRMYLLSYIYY